MMRSLLPLSAILALSLLCSFTSSYATDDCPKSNAVIDAIKTQGSLLNLGQIITINKISYKTQTRPATELSDEEAKGLTFSSGLYGQCTYKTQEVTTSNMAELKTKHGTLVSNKQHQLLILTRQ